MGIIYPAVLLTRPKLCESEFKQGQAAARHCIVCDLRG